MAGKSHSPRDDDSAAAEQDASRRTLLATERTQLAWWRTGLAALAVGIGIGRLIPELGETPTQWPYVTLGVAFAAYGVALILYGSARGRAVDSALGRRAYVAPSSRVSAGLAVAGAVLGLATAVLILVG